VARRRAAAPSASCLEFNKGKKIMDNTSNSATISVDPLGRGPANYVSLSPLSFLPRAADVYPDRLSVVHGARRYTWRESYERCRRLASALRRAGVGRGDTVALMAPNIPEAFECHFGVPMAGAILNALNTRLDAATIAFILEHGASKVDRKSTRL